MSFGLLRRVMIETGLGPTPHDVRSAPERGLARNGVEARPPFQHDTAPARRDNPAPAFGHTRWTAVRDRAVLGRPARAFRLSLLCLALAVPAASHHWYDPTCCSEQDCAPVPDAAIEAMGDGYHVTLLPGDHPMIRRPLRTVVPYQDPRINWSQDARQHACVITGKGGSQGLMCIYVTGAGG
jgi:hypothetical protein